MRWKGSYVLDIMGMDESHMDLNEDLKENYLVIDNCTKYKSKPMMKKKSKVVAIR